jgi:hypothetical protein
MTTCILPAITCKGSTSLCIPSASVTGFWVSGSAVALSPHAVRFGGPLGSQTSTHIPCTQILCRTWVVVLLLRSRSTGRSNTESQSSGFLNTWTQGVSQSPSACLLKLAKTSFYTTDSSLLLHTDFPVFAPYTLPTCFKTQSSGFACEDSDPILVWEFSGGCGCAEVRVFLAGGVPGTCTRSSSGLGPRLHSRGKGTV